MAFQPSDAFKEVWTGRVVNRLRANALAYLLGNRSNEATVQNNLNYRVANPSVTVTTGSRDRKSSDGSLADISALSADSGSLEWLTINVLANQHFQTQIDQRDVNYVTPITLGSMQTEMVNEMVDWLDNEIWKYLKGQVGASNTTAGVVAGGVTINRTTGRLTGGSKTQQLATGNSIAEWVEDMQLSLGVKNARPNVGAQDLLSGVAVMTVPMHFALRDWLINKFGTTDQIVVEQLTTEASIFGGVYRGSLFGVPILVTNASELYAQDATADTATELFRAFALIPGNTFDNAVATYPMGISTPSGDSVKYKFQQELEVWAGIVNPDSRGLFRQFTLPASE